MRIPNIIAPFTKILIFLPLYNTIRNTMTVIEKQQVYVPDALVRIARDRGLTNLSEFVRESLKEYIKAREGLQATTPATAPLGGQYDINLTD